MKFLGILRASALCLLVSGLHDQSVSCSNLEVNPSNESSSADVSENLKESTVESSSQESLPSSQSDLVFEKSSWDDSLLASAVLFLDKFCRNVSAKKFKEQVTNKNYMETSRLHYFTPTYGHEAVAGRIEIPKNFYEGILKPEDFEVYVKWLVKNIQNITESYKKMLAESLKYPSEQLKTDNTVGPLKYGFLYKGESSEELSEEILSGAFSS
ncbi:hypothetical protein X943_000809 [Babesia divergens]|uniref:Uncharacterized protein n=1 Tax=Babesia divergens TaxID=32595 RepID=A0AAD9GK91_BABDI|nr:hypothetical protein X943_000809 [Babesia divergens]